MGERESANRARYGDRVGFTNKYLTVVAFSHHEGGKRHWVCRCNACGAQSIKPSFRLLTAKSCGGCVCWVTTMKKPQAAKGPSKALTTKWV